MPIQIAAFGKTKDGNDVHKITLTNESGASVSLITYGAAVARICVPDKHGIFADVCLGYDDVAGYENAGGYLGAVIGRYGNRIGGGHLNVGGKTYQLNRNEGENTLHGGLVGFDKKVWDYETQEGDRENRIIFSLASPDGDEHFPGNLSVRVTYTWNDDCELSLHYYAVSDQPTVINLTNHAYFNLAGHASGSILDHVIQIQADRFTVVNAQSIPTGELRGVEGTPFDLRSPTPIREGMAQVQTDEQLRFTGGYDHNFVVGAEGDLHKVCELNEQGSGRVMEVFTDMPGIQFYSGNMLEVTFPAKDQARYGRNDGLCLETQFFPDTPNHPEFPQCTYDAGQPFQRTTVYKFSVPEEA